MAPPSRVGRPLVAVVIVNWNGWHLLDACLASVREQHPSPDRVIVVDNGSTDGSLAKLEARWPDVVALDAGSNLGFSGGNNLGIRDALAAGADHVLLLNNDAQLLPGALGELLAALAEAGPAVWAAAPKILYRATPDVIWSAGGRFDWWRGLSIDRGADELDQGQYDQPELMEFANACCLLVRARIFRELGFLDEAYFMYFEDSELAARAERTGARVAYQPAARVLHDVQASSGGADGGPSPAALYYWTRNRCRFIRRNVRGPVRRLAAHTYVIGSRVVRMVQAARAGRPQDARLVGRALVDAYVHGATGPRSTPPVRLP
ncbi:MAG: glycosyltransferase family 2 protein [Gemmatimonadota bacterium]|nr:glycosyltransferase family 2 protein [Gemmatimonadota bacterium]